MMRAMGTRSRSTVYQQDAANAKSTQAIPPPSPEGAPNELSGFADADAVAVSANVSNGGNENDNSSPIDDFSLRENLNETVFFYPEIEIKNGQATLSFTMNEALTKWKLLLLAHDKDLKYVFDEKEAITQKELMIEPLLPRFVRQGDELSLIHI